MNLTTFTSRRLGRSWRNNIMRTDFNEVYAIPGERTIIDGIDPDSGLTLVYGETEAAVKARYPNAVRFAWEDWRRALANAQDAPIEWLPSTAAKHEEMLNVLPPALWLGGAFLVGEPCDHSAATGRPRFAAYWQRGNVYLVASRPVTREELRAEVRRVMGGA